MRKRIRQPSKPWLQMNVWERGNDRREKAFVSGNLLCLHVSYFLRFLDGVENRRVEDVFLYFQYVLLLCQSGPIKDRDKARTESDASFDENQSQACGCLFGGISHVNFTAGNFKRPGFQGLSVCNESEDSCPNVACHPSGIPENSTCFIARIHPISLREISGFLNAGSCEIS